MLHRVRQYCEILAVILGVNGAMRRLAAAVSFLRFLRRDAGIPLDPPIYEYRPPRWGEYSLEAHLNLTAQGMPMREEAIASNRAADAPYARTHCGTVAQLRGRSDVSMMRRAR